MRLARFLFVRRVSLDVWSVVRIGVARQPVLKFQKGFAWGPEMHRRSRQERELTRPDPAFAQGTD